MLQKELFVFVVVVLLHLKNFKIKKQLFCLSLDKMKLKIVLECILSN